MERAGELPTADKNQGGAAVRGEAVAKPKTIGELFASVGGWMNGGALGYPSFCSMEALKIYTQRAVRAAVSARAADALSEPRELRQALIDVRHAIQFSHDSVGGIDKMPVMMHQPGTVVEFIDSVLSAHVVQLDDITGGVKS